MVKFQEAFAKYLPQIVEIIVEEETIDDKKYGLDQAVVDTLHKYRQ